MLGVLALLLVVGGIVLAVAWHRVSGPGLARRIESALAAATGCDVRVGSARLALPARVVIDDLVLTCPDGGQARVETMSAHVAIGKALRGDVALSRLSARGVRADWDASRPLPFPAAPESGEPRETFILGELELEDAELRLTHLPRGGAAHVRGLSVRASQDGRGAWLIKASVRDSSGAFDGRTLEHVDASASLILAAGLIGVTEMLVEIPGVLRLETRGRASLGDAGLTLDAHVSLDADAAPAASLAGFHPPGLEGRLSVEGTLRHEPTTGWTFAGEAASPRVAVLLPRADGPGIPVEWQDLTVLVEADVGARIIDLRDVRASGWGGALEGDLRLRLEPGAPKFTLQATARDVAWDALPLPPALLARTPRLARLDIEAQLAGATGDLARISGGANVAVRPDAGLVDAPSRFSLRLIDGGFTINDGEMHLAGATIQASGRADWSGSLDALVSVEAQQLHETLGLLAEAGLGPPLDARSRPRGHATWTGTVSGSLQDPVAEGELTVADAKVDSLSLGRVTAPLTLTRTRLQVTGGRVESEFVTADASLTMSLDEARTLDGEWAVSRLDLARLGSELGSTHELAGLVSGSGRFLDGPAIEARLDLAGPSIAGFAATQAHVHGTLSGEALRIHDASADLAGGGRIEAEGEIPWSGESGGLEVRVSSLAWPPDAELPWTILDGTARLAGSLREPRWEEVRGVASALSFSWLPTREIAFQARPEGVNSARIEAHAEEIALVLDGLVGLAAPHEAVASVSLDALEFEFGASAEDEGGTASPSRFRLEGLSGSLRGPLGNPARLDWTLGADTVSMDAGTFSLISEAPLRASTSAGRVVLDPASFRMSGTRLDPVMSTLLHVEATAGLTGSLPWSASVKGPVPLALLEPVSGDLRLGGMAELDMRLHGDRTDVQWTGTARVREGYAKPVGFPHALADVEADIVFEEHAAQLVAATMSVGGGRVEATGHLERQGGAIASFALLARGEDVALRLPVGHELSSVSSFDLAWAGSPEASTVSGDMRVHEATWRKDVHLDSAILRRAASGQVGAVRGPLDGIALDVGIVGDDTLFIDNDLARAEFHAALQVRGSVARPIIVGSAATLGEGSLTVRGLAYRLLGATATFTPGRPNDPELNAQAETDVAGARVVLSLTGRLSAPRIDFSSDPPLARERLVQLLLTGGGLGSSGEIDPEAGTSIGPFSFGTNRHLDVLQVDPLALDVSGERSARLTIGKNLTPRLFAAYSTFLAGAQQPAAEIRYRIKGGALARLAREADGAAVIEMRYVRPPRRPREEDGVVVPRTASITFTGAEDEEFWAEILPLKVGAPAGDGDLRRAARAARLEAATRDRPLARARCTGLPAPDDPDMRDVTCAVDGGPLVKLEIEGLPRDERRQVARAVRAAWAELSVTEQLLPEALDAARDMLEARGHLGAQVDGVVSAEPDESVVVTLEVDPGARSRVGEVIVTGTEYVSGDEVSDMLAGRDTTLRKPWLTSGSIEAARRYVRGRLVALGHLGADVGEITTEPQEDGELARLIIPALPGPRARVRSVEITGATQLTKEEISDATGAVPGEWLDPLRLDAGARGIEDRYDEEGMPDAAVSWTTLPGEQDGEISPVDVRVDVIEGRQETIGQVRVSGAVASDPDHLLRVAHLKPGAPLRRRDMLAAQARLTGLGTLRRVIVAPAEEPGEGGSRDVVLEIQERDRMEFSTGLAWVDERGPRVSLRVARRNVAGRAGTVGVDLESGKDERAEVFTSWKRLRGGPIDLVSSAGLRNEALASFDTRRIGISVEGIRDLSGGRSLRARYRIEEVSVRTPEDSAADPDIFDGRLATLGLTFTRDTRDDALDPQRGSLSSVDLALGSPFLGSQASYAKLFVQHARSVPLTRRMSYAAGIRLGAGWTFGSTPAIPVSERFFAGGVTSVRGYSRDGLGPKNLTGRPVGGAALLVVNQELRFRFGSRWSVIIFADAGNVFEGSDELRFSSLRLAAGPGFGIATPAGPVRLYYAVPLGPGDDEPRLQLTFGPVF